MARNRLGWSQEELAEKIGFKSFQQVSKYENDRAEPSLEKVREIARVTGRPLYWFFLDPVGVELNFPEDRINEFWSKVRDIEKGMGSSGASLTRECPETGTRGYAKALYSSSQEEQELTNQAIALIKRGTYSDQEETVPAGDTLLRLIDRVEALSERLEKVEKYGND